MKVTEVITKLEQNQWVFKSLLEGKVEVEYLWRPEPNKWNFLEIVCHLLDEELLDFRRRTKHALETPKDFTPAIAPECWVIDHDYV